MPTTHLVAFVPGYVIRVTIGDDTYVPAESSADLWEHRAYRATITYRGRVTHLTYRAGMSIPAGNINPRDILASMVSDATAADHSFAEFCNEYGYDESTADARRIYRACDAQFQRIRRIFKNDARAFYDMVNGWEL